MNTRTLLALPYEIARAPLAVIDTQIAQRLPQDSLPRLAFDRALGSYDQFAGRLLANKAIVEQGTDRITRSGKLAEALTLENDAAAKREQAQQAGSAGRRSARELREAAQQRVADGLDVADATERRGKQAAATGARRQAAKDKQAVQERTEQRTTSIRRQARQSDQVANARQTAARKAAEAKLDDAAQTRKAARATRADADKLGDLTDAKKDARTS